MNIAIFASGNGSNAEQIIRHFKGHASVQVSLIVSSKASAYVVERAHKHNISCSVLDKESFNNSNDLLKVLRDHSIDFIVLAGFMWLVPGYLVGAYPDKMVNIHPALLPKYGGVGMYGMHVHRAVVEAKETESGISIHYVNEKYDEGNIIAQFSCVVDAGDTPESLAEKIHALEHAHYPRVIEGLLTEK